MGHEGDFRYIEARAFQLSRRRAVLAPELRLAIPANQTAVSLAQSLSNLPLQTSLSHRYPPVLPDQPRCSPANYLFASPRFPICSLPTLLFYFPVIQHTPQLTRAPSTRASLQPRNTPAVTA